MFYNFIEPQRYYEDLDTFGDGGISTRSIVESLRKYRADGQIDWSPPRRSSPEASRKQEINETEAPKKSGSNSVIQLTGIYSASVLFLSIITLISIQWI